MDPIILIDYFINTLYSSFGNLGLTVSVVALFVLLMFTYVAQLDLLPTLVITGIPFLIGGITALINIKYGIGVFIILGGLLLAVGIANLFLNK